MYSFQSFLFPDFRQHDTPTLASVVARAALETGSGGRGKGRESLAGKYLGWDRQGRRESMRCVQGSLEGQRGFGRTCVS